MASPKSDQIRALREMRFEKLTVKLENTFEAGTEWTQAPLDTIVINSKGDVINTDAQRQAKWRTANLELNRQRAREGMRKRRAKTNG